MYLFLIVLLLFLRNSIGQSIVGNDCNSGEAIGVCTPVYTCKAAYDSIIKNGFHNFNRCGFQNRDEIVCCPQTNTAPVDNRFATTSPTVGTKQIADVGDVCNVGEVAGICTLVQLCAVAMAAIVKDGNHKLNRCSFKQLDEVICCPRTQDSIQNKPTVGDFASSTINGNQIESLMKDVFTSKTVPAASNNLPMNMDQTTRKQTISRLRRSEYACLETINSVPPPVASYIVNGENATIGEFPHMVALGYLEKNKLSFLCGGTLISPNFVLTAAHCNRVGFTVATTRIGTLDLAGDKYNPTTDFNVTQVIVHPQYKKVNVYYDIALLRLERPVPVTPTSHAACLPTTGSIDASKNNLIVTGWGRTQDYGEKSLTLLKTALSLVTADKCNTFYPPERRLMMGLNEKQICAQDVNGQKDSCQGDSGGPIQTITHCDGHYTVIGITSFGKNCAGPYPGVYTKVYEYLDWIENIVWPDVQPTAILNSRREPPCS